MDDKVKQLIECGNNLKIIANKLFKQKEEMYLSLLGKDETPCLSYLLLKNNLNMINAQWDTLCKEMKDEAN